MFGATKLYPQFLSLLGRPATFWLYGAVMVVEIVYAAITIPENRGESLVRTEVGYSKDYRTRLEASI